MNKKDLVEFSVRFAYVATRERLARNEAVEWGWYHQLKEDALAVLRLAGQHQRLCELACSWSGWSKAHEAKLDAIEDKLTGMAERLEIDYEIQRDPRGATVRIGNFPVPASGFTAAQLERMS